MEKQTVKIGNGRWVDSIRLAILGIAMAAGAPAHEAAHIAATGLLIDDVRVYNRAVRRLAHSADKGWQLWILPVLLYLPDEGH